jgi:hypothetical protein
MLQNLLCSASQIYSRDFANFCGLLRLYDFYDICNGTISLETGQAGLEAVFQVPKPGDFSLQPQQNPYPTLTPLPAECVTFVQSVALSMVRQYAVWYQHATPRTRGRFLMMIIHHTHHLFTSFQHSLLDGAQDGSN